MVNTTYPGNDPLSRFLRRNEQNEREMEFLGYNDPTRRPFQGGDASEATHTQIPALSYSFCFSLDFNAYAEGI